MKNDVRCYSNVAAFGIDGCMSTFIGQSVITDNLCFMIIGDLSFFYDMNSLGIKYIKNNVRIILINNNGGFEFKIGDNKEKNLKTDRFIAAANHFRNAEGWSITNGFNYKSIKDKDAFISVIPTILGATDKPLLVEIFTDDLTETEAYMALRKANDMRTTLEKMELTLKRNVKKFLHL